MSEKDVKTKPKASPKTISKETVKKVAVKGKESATSAIKDAKTAMKDAILKKAVDSKLGTEKETEEPKKVDTEATENVESAVYVTGDVAYRKTKG